MNPALLRFLAVFTENLEKAQRKLVRLAPSPEFADPTHKELCDLIDSFKENINDKTARNFIDKFDALKEKAHSDFFKEFEDNQIYTLKLLLHESEANREFRLSSFAKHFAPFLQCPFEVKLENDDLKFVLFYNANNTESGKEQRKNGERFYQALTSLGIEPEATSENNNRVTITISSNHKKDMLQLAQFELIDEKIIPKTQTDLDQKFRHILTELIQTEASFSKQCEALAGIIADTKLGTPKCTLKLEEDEENLLIQAQKYYQEIADNDYPWFGEKITPEQLTRMSFDEMLQLCHDLYEQLRTTDKAEKISKRLAIMRWVSIEHAELNRLINSENKLNLYDNGTKECKKQIANQCLIPPVQRLPRIILLTGELIKCVNTALYDLSDLNLVVSRQLRALNEKWLTFAKETNDLINEREQLKSSEEDDIAKRIFQSFARVLLNKPVNVSASFIQQDFANEFHKLPCFTQQSHLIGNLPNQEIPSLESENSDENLDDFYDMLTQSMIFAEGTASVSANSEVKADKLVISDFSDDDLTRSRIFPNSKSDEPPQPGNVPGNDSTKNVLKKLNKTPASQSKQIQSSVKDPVKEKETVPHSLSLSPPTLSQIGGGVAVFAGIALIVAGIALTLLLQPALLLFVLAAALVIEGCLLAGMGVALLEEKPAPIDFDKDPNRPYFLGGDVGITRKLQAVACRPTFSKNANINYAIENIPPPTIYPKETSLLQIKTLSFNNGAER